MKEREEKLVFNVGIVPYEIEDEQRPYTLDHQGEEHDAHGHPQDVVHIVLGDKIPHVQRLLERDGLEEIGKKRGESQNSQAPSCIKVTMMAWPKGIKSLAVSSTISPVTQTAVNSASIKQILCVVALGNIDNIAPAKAKVRKLPTNKVAGFEEEEYA